jgi:hypothetical protein
LFRDVEVMITFLRGFLTRTLCTNHSFTSFFFSFFCSTLYGFGTIVYVPIVYVPIVYVPIVDDQFVFVMYNIKELEDFLIAHRDEYMIHAAKNYTTEQKDYNNRLTSQLIECAKDCGYGPLFTMASQPQTQAPQQTPPTGPTMVDIKRNGNWKEPSQLEAVSINGGTTISKNSISNSNNMTPPISPPSLIETEFGSFAVVRDRIRCYYKSYVQSSKRRELRRKRKFGILCD